ncbi:MAG: acyloxyacyl hydrolase [Hyphomicrobiaceae bacterium]
MRMSSSLTSLVLAIVASSAAGPTWEASAQTASPIRELRLGILAHDVPGLWSGFRIEQDAIALNAEVIFSPSLPFLWGAIRPAIGATIATEGGTNTVYADARWEIEANERLFFSIGLGAGVHDGATDVLRAGEKALGTRVLFHVPIEAGIRLDGHNSVSAYFEHFSNAGLGRFNEGLDRIGLRYGYRF